LTTIGWGQVPTQFTVNNLGTPELNGTYVVQDANAEYPVYVNQTDPQYVLFSSGPPPGLPFIPATWRFSKFTGYSGTGSMSGLPKQDFYEYSSPSFQPLAPIFADMANFPVFRDVGVESLDQVPPKHCFN